MMKRILSFILALALLLGNIPAVALAVDETAAPAETANVQSLTGSGTVAPDPGLPENGELFAAYAERVLYGNQPATFGIAAGERLDGDEKRLYDALVPAIKQIAAGERASSFISVGQQVGADYIPDVDVIFEETGLTDDAISSMINRVVAALLSDLPYEMYWYDKTAGCSYGYILDSDGTLLYIQLIFFVAQNYQGGSYDRVDTAKAGAAADAAGNAAGIVSKYASASDYEKLCGYRDEICALVSYNNAAAAAGNFSSNDDPWQLIYVFDGDSSTNVVCEGYSKAFMYLCDLTDFAGEVACYTVSGYMDGGAHMWNIVTIDGANYLVDVTNSDSGMIGQNGGMFLSGSAGSAAEGYSFLDTAYVYDSSALSLWGSDESSILTLAAEDYDPTVDEPVEDENIVASGTCGDNLTWTLDDEGTLTISGTGTMTDYESASDAPWYADRASITSIVIEDSATAIGARAFYNCTALTDITIGSGVITIGTYAFRGCTALEEVTIPANVTAIEGSAFRACTTLISVTFEGNAPTMGDYVFNDGASSLTVHCYEGATGFDVSPWTDYTVSVDHVGQWIIDSEATCTTDGSKHIDCSYCGTTITETIPCGHNYVDGICSVCGDIQIIDSGRCGTNVTWKLDYLGTLTLSGTGAMVNKSSASSIWWYDYRTSIQSVVIEEGVTSIGDYAFSRCSNLTDVQIADSVTSIRSSAFSSCSSLTSIEIPDSVTYFGSCAFESCTGLTSFTIPDGVTYIYFSTFSNCTGLTSIVIPSNVTSIGESAFRQCTNLVSVTLPDSITKINANTFMYCSSLESINIPDSVTSIGAYAFLKCSSLTSITLPDSITSIGSQAFSSCSSLTNIRIPDSVTSIGGSAFAYCSGLTSVRIPDSVTSFGTAVFSGCSNLETVTLGTGLTSISDQTFYGCSSLTTIDVPDNVTSIGDSAFYNCGNLTSVSLADSVTSIGESAFESCSKLENIEISDSLTSVGASAFRYCESLTAIDLPDCVTSIGSHAFYGCISLASIEIPAGVTSISGFAFRGCSSLESITLPDGIASIGGQAFEGCSNLKSITLPNGVTGIGDSAFAGCSSLTSFVIPDSVTTIGSGALGSCSGLTSLEIPDSVTSIGSSAFSGCSGLTSITLPSSITTIERHTFCACSSLSYIVIPAKVTSIGSYAFWSCGNLDNITFTGDAPEFSDDAFKWATATAYYPADNATWTSDVMQDYCGTITWVAYGESGDDEPELPVISGDSFDVSLPASGEVEYLYTPEEDGFYLFYFGSETWGIGFTVYANDDNSEIDRGDWENTETGNHGNSFELTGGVEYRIVVDNHWEEERNETVSIAKAVSYDTMWIEGDESCYVGNEIFLNLRGTPDFAMEAATWTVSDSGIVEITSSRATSLDLRGLSAGTVTVTATTESGKTASFEVTVMEEPTSGTWGENLTWEFDASTGTLTMSGEGEMDGTLLMDTPWWNNFDQDIINLVINEGITSIGTGTFSSCRNLQNVQIPNSVTTIGGAFYGCASLTAITIPSGVTTIGNSAFEDCSGLTSLTIPASVTTIGEHAFFLCTGLQSITFEGDAPVFETEEDGSIYTFGGVTATVYYPADNTTWTADVMQDYGGTITWVPYGKAQPLEAPTAKISGDAATGKPVVKWNTVEGAVKYRVYRSTKKSSGYELVCTAKKGRSYTDTTAKVGTNYYYKVKAVHEDSSLNSDWSNVVNRMCDLPQPEVSITGSSATGKPIVKWETVDGAAKYRVYRATSKDGDYELIYTGISARSYTDKTAEAGTTYYYKVKAVHSKSSADSALSDVVSRLCDLAKPVVSITRKNGDPRLTWDKIDGAAKYYIYRATSKDGEYEKIKTTVSATSFTDTTAKAGTKYFYKVKAIHKNTDANSAYSSVKYITAK